MEQKIKAVYENGVFRPLGPVSLHEAEKVTITISDPQLLTAVATSTLLNGRVRK